ncbi:MAG: RNA methyltransferase [Lachnospiraceae bacterium]|nr:RNA methyltransferase [Lachnospiraceae bacterium]
MISSSANAQIKYLVKLQEKGAARRADKVYVCEGRKMFGEVLQYARESIVKAYFSESFYAEWAKQPENAADASKMSEVGYEVVADHVFREISRTVTPQGVLAIVRQPEYCLETLLAQKKVLGQRQEPSALRLLLLENLRDPGNLGTILRTAEGAGMDGVILSSESVDMFNPKVIRSTMGAIYRVPFVYVPDFLSMVRQLRQQGIAVYAAHLEGASEYDTLKYPPRTAFMIGNEANGLTEEAAQAANARIRIPMEGGVESLNAAVAAAVLMYEAYRQVRKGENKTG